MTRVRKYRMMRWIRLARELTKAGPKEALDFMGSLMNRVLSKNENVPDVNYPNRSISIKQVSEDLIIKLAKYQVVLEVDKLLDTSSINQLQWLLQLRLSNTYGVLPPEDTATISALMVQKLQEEEYIKDIAPPV